MKKVYLIICAIVLFLVINVLYYKKPSTNLVNGFKGVTHQAEGRVIAPLYDDKNLFLSAIKQVKSNDQFTGVTGIVVPHHLLAIDLMAKTFAAIKINNYQQIILVSPDHFGACKKYICYSTNNFSTVFGTIDSLQNLDLGEIGKENFLFKEHGVQAILPFINYYFPNVKILVITFNYSTPQKQVDELINKITPILNKDTLVIQSTDFSHYLNKNQANIKDEETLNIIKGDDVGNVFNLNQPGNIDSKASQYFQSKLQKEYFKSKLNIYDHKNSQDYTNEYIASTTSYIVEVYSQGY